MAKHAKPAEKDSDEDVGEETPSKKAGVSVIMIAALALLAGSGGAGIAYFLAPTSQPITQADETIVENKSHADVQASDDGHKAEKGQSHKKKKNDHGGSEKTDFEGGEMHFYGDKAYFRLDPFIISIQPIGQSRHVKIALVIETSSDHADALTEHTYHIRDILNTYLRSVDSTEFEDPAAMGRLRSQIMRRIHAIAPNIVVQNVLITEFILT